MVLLGRPATTAASTCRSRSVSWAWRVRMAATSSSLPGACEMRSAARWIASIGLIGVVLFHIWATVYTLRHQRQFQVHATAFVEPLMRFLFGSLRSRQRYGKEQISPYFYVNGYPPESETYTKQADPQFAEWRMTSGGLVERPLVLSLADLRALPKQEQITKHN